MTISAGASIDTPPIITGTSRTLMGYDHLGSAAGIIKTFSLRPHLILKLVQNRPRGGVQYEQSEGWCVFGFVGRFWGGASARQGGSSRRPWFRAAQLVSENGCLSKDAQLGRRHPRRGQ